MNFAHGLSTMKRSPGRGWTLEDVIQACKTAGARCVLPAQGSHYVISHHLVDGLLTIPAKGPLKPFHIMLVVDLVETVIERKKWYTATKSSFSF